MNPPGAARVEKGDTSFQEKYKSDVCCVMSVLAIATVAHWPSFRDILAAFTSTDKTAKKKKKDVRVRSSTVTA